MSGHVLLTLATNPIPLASLDLSLSSYYDPDSGWRTELFVDLPPHNIVEEITSFHSIHDLEDRDEGFWYGTPSGAFSTKSAYELVSPIPNDRTEEAKWKSLWRIKGPQRVRVFLWKLCNRGILTNAICVRRHMGNCDLCPLCRSSYEDYLHLFRDCSAVSDFWHAAWKGGRRDAFFHANWDEWITENITGYLQGNCELDWPRFFAAALSAICRMRNEWVFNHTPFGSARIWSLLKSLGMEQRSLNSAFLASLHDVQGQHRGTFDCSPPPSSCYRLVETRRRVGQG